MFNDRSTFERVENVLFKRGEYTGTVRGTERYGLRFETPIGFQLRADGSSIPLHYGELKLNLDTGFYHIMPRTGPSTP